MRRQMLFFFALALTISYCSYGQWIVRPIGNEEFDKKIQLPLINNSESSTYYQLWAIEYDTIWLKSLQSGEKYTFISDDKAKVILEKKISEYDTLYNDSLDSYYKLKILQNKGICELGIGHTEKAKTTFNYLLNIKYDTTETYEVKSKCGYDGIKNKIAELLAKMAMTVKNYKEALYYLDLAVKYPYDGGGCGNAYADNAFDMTYKRATCYIEMDSFQKAQEVLLPSMLPSWLEYNKELAEMLYPILLRTYSRDKLAILYEDAFKNYTTEIDECSIPKKQFYIYFLNTKIQIYVDDSDDLANKAERDKKVMKVYTSSILYLWLHEK